MKFLLVTCLLAGIAVAQQTEEKQDPKHKKGKGENPRQKAQQNAQPNAQKKAAPEGAKRAAPEKAEAKKAPAAPKQEKREGRKPSKAPAAPVANEGKPRKEAKAPAAEKPANRPAARKENPAARSVEARKRRGQANPEAPKDRPPAERANPKSAKNNRGARDGENAPERRVANARKPDPQKVKEIRAQHQNFRAEARPDRVPTVTFTENRRIENSDCWKGPQYEVFRSYRPERHDEGWYRSRYDRVELISGGYYYRRDNYWYPAWGYQPSSEYYAYDGPIYVGKRADPPDRVIADVQAALQDMDYYKGEVDGLLGPLTRDALVGYQSDQGLEPTAAIDEPTLDELDLN